MLPGILREASILFWLEFFCCYSNQFSLQLLSRIPQKRYIPSHTRKTSHFQPAKERFHNAIVVAIPFSGHGLNDLMLLKFASICCVLVLPALIRMHNQSIHTPTTGAFSIRRPWLEEKRVYKLEYLLSAVADMVDAVTYISQHLCPPQAAEKLMEAFGEAAHQAAQFPYSNGAYRPLRPLGKEYRKATAGSYLMFYWVDEDTKTVVIARAIYGRMDYGKVRS